MASRERESLLVVLLALAVSAAQAAAQDPPPAPTRDAPPELAGLSLEQLLDTEVTLVSRKQQPWLNAFDPRHFEFDSSVSGRPSTEVERAVSAGLTWRF